MRRIQSRLLSLFISFLMVFSLMPFPSAYADTTGSIDFVGLSTSSSSPTQVNTSTVDFSVTFSNVNASSLTYTLQQVSLQNGQVVKTSTPSISGSVQPQNLSPQNSPTQAAFTGIPLFEGLNQITVTGTLANSSQSGSTSSGSVTKIAYVNYLNVPIITSVDAGSTTNLTNTNNVAFVTGSSQTGNTSFTVHTQNADSLSITQNGQPVSSSVTTNPIGSPINEFVVTNVSLNPGENDFTFTAKNTLRNNVTNFSIKVIYFNNKPVIYNLSGQFSSATPPVAPDPNQGTSIINGQTVPISGSQYLQNIVGGEVLIPNTSNINSTVTANLIDSNNTPKGTYQLTLSSDPAFANSSYPFSVYKMTQTSSSQWQLVTSGTYTLQFPSLTASGDQVNITFTVQNSSNLENPSLYQLQNVTWNGSSSNSYAGNATTISGPIAKQQGPVYIASKFNNSISQSDISSTSVSVNGQSVPVLQAQNVNIQLIDSSGTNYGSAIYLNGTVMNSNISGGVNLNGALGLQIDNLPTGTYSLNFYDSTQDSGLGKLLQTVTIQNYNAPSVQLVNVYDGEVFNGSTQTITVQANNFNTNPGAMNVSINGVAYSITPSVTTITTSSGTTVNRFTFSNLPLSEGPNKLDFSANDYNANTGANTTIDGYFTLYYYSNSLPVISVQPSGVSSVLDSGIQTSVSNTGNNTYSTDGSTVTIQGNYSNALTMSVQSSNSQNGNILGDNGSDQISIPNLNYSKTNGSSGNQIKLNTTSATAGLYSGSFALTQPLQNGQNVFTITIFDGSNGNQSQITVTITKVQLPFSVVSPSIPMNGTYQAGQKSISYGPYDTNQNFIDLIIKAATANSVTIGTNTAAIVYQDTTNGITLYGTEVQNLKPGLNSIPVQITSGTNKIKGTVVVNYLNQNVVGAQNRLSMSSSGKTSAFNGLVQLQFPKNTTFQQQSLPGQLPSNPEFFANLSYLFGIANKNTGEITIPGKVNTYYSGQSSYNVLQSLNSQTIPLGYSDNFSYASNLFWIDAGDPNFQSNLDPNGNSFVTAGGFDPYYPYNLDQTNYWNNLPSSIQLQSFDYHDRSANVNDWLKPTNPGTITLQYDSNIRNIDTTNLTIMYLDHSGAWEKIGGTVNVSNHTITAPFQGFGYYVVVNVDSKYSDINSFVDSGNQSWARTYLNIMLAKGIMIPESGTYFGVSDNITRGEFAEVLVKALNLPLNYDSQASFDDVPYSTSTVQITGQLWSYPYIETATRFGIIKGISSRVFAPNLPITRQDAAVMIARAANFKMALDPTAAIAALQKAFTDAGSIDPYAAPGVLAVYKSKIVTGYPTNPGAKKTTYYFGPTNNLLRSEAAVIAVHLMQQLKLLPTAL